MIGMLKWRDSFEQHLSCERKENGTNTLKKCLPQNGARNHGSSYAQCTVQCGLNDHRKCSHHDYLLDCSY